MKKDGDIYEKKDFCSECAEEYPAEDGNALPPPEAEDEHCCCCCGCCSSESEMEEQAVKESPLFHPNYKWETPQLKTLEQSDSNKTPGVINKSDVMLALAKCGLNADDNLLSHSADEQISFDNQFCPADSLGIEFACSNQGEACASIKISDDVSEMSTEKASSMKDLDECCDCGECECPYSRERNSRGSSRQKTRRRTRSKRNMSCQCDECLRPKSEMPSKDASNNTTSSSEEKQAADLVELELRAVDGDTVQNTTSLEVFGTVVATSTDKELQFTTESESDTSCCELCEDSLSSSEDQCNCPECGGRDGIKGDTIARDESTEGKLTGRLSGSAPFLTSSTEVKNRDNGDTDSTCDQCDVQNLCPCEQCQPQNTEDDECCEVCGFCKEKGGYGKENFGDDFFF